MISKSNDIYVYIYYVLKLHKAIIWNTENQLYINTLRPRQNGRHFADDIFKCIFFNENV